MSIKDLIHQAKSLVVEEDPTPVATVKPGVPAPHPAFNLPPASFSTGGGAAAAPAPIGGSPFAVPTTVVMNEDFYKTVLAKTNFNTTPVGKAIIKYYDALEGVIADQTGRFKAAIQQAQKLEGITPDQVLATFDQIQAALDADGQAFQRAADNEEATQITARQTKITSLQQQAETINQQITQLQSDLATAQGNHASTVSQYGAVQQRRAQEIAAQKAQVASLLH